HRSIEVIANLRHLSGCNEGADRHQAAVSGRQSRTQPKVTEKHIGGVLDNARRDCAEILLDTGCALLLHGLFKRKAIHLGGWSVIGAEAVRLRYYLNLAVDNGLESGEIAGMMSRL